VFDLSPEKILLLGVIAVIFLGPDRLPSAARTLAKVLHQFRTASGSLQAEMREALAEPRQALTDAVGDLGLPTDLGLPRMPTARSLVTQALNPPPPASGRLIEASSTNGASVERSSEGSLPGAPPDDPSLN
jgi:sec-independent protein translocase protein TatB